MSAKRALTDEEIQKLLNEGFTGEYKLRNRAIFCMGLSTGYRAKEILSHKIGDVMAKKFVREVIEIPKRLRKGNSMGQTKKLMPFAQKALQQHIDQVYEESGHDRYGLIFNRPLFESNKRDPHTGARKPISARSLIEIFNDAFYICNIEGAVGTHSMRKTAAKKCYEKAVEDFRSGRIDIEPIRVCKMFLGHRDIASTENYLSFLSYDLNEEDYNFQL
jgi:integrase